MKALVTDRGILNRFANLASGKSIGTGAKVKDVPKPSISGHEVLVSVRATALNPIDYKFIDFIAPSDAIVGCDFAGEIAEVGKDAAKTWKVGDRVAGFVQGGIDRGSFADYVKTEEDLLWRIPPAMSNEEASTYGVSAVTAMQALNVHLAVPWADEATERGESGKAPPVFIYAGSSTVGLSAIQIAKKAGCTVVTTASPHSFDLVKRYGADRVFDYRSATAVKDITEAFPDITRALDCFSEGGSTEFCAQVLKKKGGKVITLLDTGKAKVPGVEVQMIMSFQLLGRAFAWLQPIGPKFPVSPEERKALVRFYASLSDRVEDLKPPPIEVMDGGLSGVLKGLDRLRAGKVSGCKLVVKY
ncbi:Zinc-binding oxidoreductase alcohol dehydrogenase [Neofusicoccum ribis]|uniref:Zinc-binding oxidoreductase alcohol dehydrogenase n=1 Tax=Neofusicoccum ribis TaxID=45134 RepID=A0ABR3SNK5_9PEZI